VGVEAANQLGVGERYHGPLRRTFDILYTANKDMSNYLDDDTLPQIAVSSLNSSIGVTGLAPSILVFGVVPKLPIPDSPAAAQTMSTRQRLQQEALDFLVKDIARRRVSTALTTRTAATAQATLFHGDAVLVWRPLSGKPTRGKWTKGYSFL
jgi:hypothetical protein